MNRLALALLLFTAALSWALVDGPPSPRPNTVELNGHTFTLPEGFTIELVAGPPLVDRPITADFDEQGRLYVSDSSGSNEPVAVQVQKRPHRILRLEDTDGDGRFDKRTVFADQMMFPEGTMWFDGSLYVSAPPSIWKLTDTDGAGVADRREEWFKGKTLTGCANDLHGPYLGPDGWIYWCKGAFARQTYERPGKPPFTTRAAHIFRCRPDGSGIEPVMTGGMDNPVDVVFTPGGERIFTTTFFQHPGGGHRDGLVHAVYGGVYGKDHDVVYEHKWTGPALMPVLTHLGPAAPAGLCRYESEAFGRVYQNNLFAACFNLHKVTRHVLSPTGSTFRTWDVDFVVSNNLDFHPTDVLEDAEGSLLIVDTGGWYKLCCPTSQLHKPDVLGAIYRVRRTDAPKVDDPRGLKIDWAKLSPEVLCGLLSDQRPAVRRRAVAEAGKRGPAIVPQLAQVLQSGSSSSIQKLNAVWAATRIDSPAARAVVRSGLEAYPFRRGLGDPAGTVRQASLHSISLWRDREALPTLVNQLAAKGLQPQNRRGVVEALGRIGDKSAVPALLAAAGEPADRALEHAIRYALIEINDRDGTAAGLQSANALTRQGALVALDEMDDGKLAPATVAAELNSPDPGMKETAAWIAGRHPDWGGALAGYLRDRLASMTLTPAEREELVGQLARFTKSGAVQALLADRLRDASAPREVRQTALRAMAQSHLKEAPDAWAAALTEAVSGNDSELVREGVATARALTVPRPRADRLVGALLKVARDGGSPVNVRLTALAAVPGGLTEVEPALFDLLRAQLNPDQPVIDRSLAADVLSRAKPGRDQLLALTETLKTAGPMEVDRLLDAYTKTTDEAVGQALLAALKSASARSSLRSDAIKQRLAKYGPEVRKQAEELYALLDVDAGKQRAHLEQLLVSLGKGDVRRGQAVFNSPKAACVSCHAVGYLGGKVGPDLTRIGKIRSERDLLEAIVYPSASFVRGYEPVTVTTRAGKVVNGILRKDAPEEVVLAVNATEEVRIARTDIEEMLPGKVSVMPAGLDQQLTPQDLWDLVAFLKACQ
jgi:putative membrane-bound dehydrogenase-like protein